MDRERNAPDPHQNARKAVTYQMVGDHILSHGENSLTSRMHAYLVASAPNAPPQSHLVPVGRVSSDNPLRYARGSACRCRYTPALVALVGCDGW